MKHIKSYKHYENFHNIYENVQQFDKLLKNYLNINPKYDKSGLYKLKDDLQINGLISYLGPITKIILGGVDTDFFEEDVDDIIDGIKFLKNNNYDLSKLDINSIYDFNDKVYELEQKNVIRQYINRWVPASIRKNALENWEKLSDYLTEIENETLSEDLLKKGSRFKTGEEWIDYLIKLFNGDGYNLEELKKSNIKIFYEDKKILIYKPLDYKSYMIVNYKHWCTMQEIMFNRYLKMDLIICLNKQDILDSLISYVDSNKIEVFNYGNYHITNNIPDKYKDDVDKMKSYHKFTKEEPKGYFTLPYNEGFFDTQFTTDNDADKWSKMVKKYKPNFENFIGFLISNLFYEYDIYEKKTSPIYKKGSVYWYGPQYIIEDGYVSHISMFIEQIDVPDNLRGKKVPLVADLYDIKDTLEEISGMKFNIEYYDYVDDNAIVKCRVIITFNIKPKRI